MSTTMNLQDYITSKTEGKQPKIPSDILSKWTARNGAAYAAQGAAGAQVYMNSYAKTAGAAKVVALGRLALATGSAGAWLSTMERLAMLAA